MGTLYRTDPTDIEGTTLAPDPPVLQVGATTSAAVELSWTAVSAAEDYELERRSPAGSGTWGRVYGPGPEASYRDEAVAAATQYEYRVRALLSGGEMTEWSEPVTATTDP